MIKILILKHGIKKRCVKIADKTFNFVGLKCPLPVLKTKKELKNLTSGQIIEVISDDIGSLKDVPALLHKTGDELISTNEEGNLITFTIKKS